MVEPIRPCDVKHEIPDFIIEAVNKLIQEKWDGYEATVKQSEILSAINLKEHKTTSKEIFDRGWMDIEDIYRKRGWDVTYESPDYTESFPPYFTFKPKK